MPRAGEIGKGIETERFHSLWSMVRWKGEIGRPRLLLGVIGLLEDALGRLTEFHTSLVWTCSRHSLSGPSVKRLAVHGFKPYRISQPLNDLVPFLMGS